MGCMVSYVSILDASRVEAGTGGKIDYYNIRRNGGICIQLYVFSQSEQNHHFTFNIFYMIVQKCLKQSVACETRMTRQ